MRSRFLRLETCILALPVLVAVALMSHLATPEAPEVELAGYATGLRERTASQQHNAARAASAINRAVIEPGAEFSFNKTVKSWSLDRGYVKAPVSYDGDLIKAYGGGVCQTSTTLYNAALLAGLPIIERHPHAFAPHYVPPGRDAAVAQYDVDLRFRNPYPWPIRIVTVVDEDHLTVRIMGAHKPDLQVGVRTDQLDRIVPRRLTRVTNAGGYAKVRPYLRNPGAFGYRVVTYRVFSSKGVETRREQLADDSYQAMNRVVQVTDD